MKRTGLILMAVLLSGCWLVEYGYRAPQTPTPAPTFAIPFLTPSPTLRPIDVPSGSCIFTLDVSNESSGSIYVQINEIRVATVPAQATKRFMDQHGDGLPEMPWQVLLIRTSDGATLGQGSFTYDQLDGHMTARDQEATSSSRECAPG